MMDSLNPKLAKKISAFTSRTADILDITENEVVELFSKPQRQSIRKNTLKVSSGTNGSDWLGNELEWCPNGYELLKKETARDSHLVKEGYYYIQNASSWLPVLALDPQPGEKILDMCAAPGGKSAHIAAITNNAVELWVNDNSPARLAKLKANFTRLGVNTASYTLYDAQYLHKKLVGNTFDKILLDAPCSGEGFINLNEPKTYEQWSVAKIKRLSTLQKRLIASAWQLLKPGGTLVYSTCTLAPEENEAVISFLVKYHEDAQAVLPLRFDLPEFRPGLTEWGNRIHSPQCLSCLRVCHSDLLEAFFVAKIYKKT